MPSDQPVVAHHLGDVVNALPAVLGFRPEESLVAIQTTGPRHRFGFSIRIDLPADGTALDPGAAVGTRAAIPTDVSVDALVAATAGQLRRHRAEGAIVVAVSERPELAGVVVRAVEAALGPVLPVVLGWATEQRYWTTFEDCPAEGIAYARDLHSPAVVQAVAAGREVLPDRATLAARVAPVTGERRRWLEHAAQTVSGEVVGRIVTSPDPVATGRAEVDRILAGAVAARRVEDGDALRLGFWLADIRVRDHVWEAAERDDDQALLDVLCQVARLVPVDLSPAPLSLAAITAWYRGEGALALCAAERAAAVDSDYTMAALVLRLIEHGIDPRTWPRGTWSASA